VITAPNIGDLKVRGLIETDFYGSGSENGAALRMRRAFGEVKGEDWLFLFGQEWEIISPLFPDTINFMYGAFSGNPGFRYPQVRYDRWWGCGDGTLKAQVALQAEIPQGNSGDVDRNGKADGTDAGKPSVLARLGYNQGKLQAGLSGHYGCGSEEADWDRVNSTNTGYTNGNGNDEDFHSWSLNTDLRVPLGDMFTFTTEMFWAENYDTHSGTLNGIRQKTDVFGNIYGDEIEVMGGWAQLTCVPNSDWKFNAGVGLVDPVDNDLDDAMMSMNHYYYGNAWYYFSKYLMTGIEISYYETKYKNSDDGDNLRVQNAWMLKF